MLFTSDVRHTTAVQAYLKSFMILSYNVFRCMCNFFCTFIYSYVCELVFKMQLELGGRRRWYFTSPWEAAVRLASGIKWGQILGAGRRADQGRWSQLTLETRTVHRRRRSRHSAVGAIRDNAERRPVNRHADGRPCRLGAECRPIFSRLPVGRPTVGWAPEVCGTVDFRSADMPQFPSRSCGRLRLQCHIEIPAFILKISSH